MDVGTVIILVLAAIIILAAIGIIAQARERISKSSAEAYSVRMNANAAVIARLAPHGPHRITIDSTAILRVAPHIEDTSTDIAPPKTSDSVRYLNDDSHPDSQERRDLLSIVNHTIVKSGDGTTIRAGNKCNSDGLIDPVRWTSAIRYGVSMFGVVAKPRDVTEVGAYGTLSRLADAINKYETINPTPPAKV